MKNEYWVMCKLEQPSPGSPLVEKYRGGDLPHIFIVELTPDEMAFLWPVVPAVNSLCDVCELQNVRCTEFCKVGAPSGRICNFKAVPEVQASQDFDSILVEGEYFAVSGYYRSFEDFKHVHQYTDDHFGFFLLGMFDTISDARYKLNEMYQRMRKIPHHS